MKGKKVCISLSGGVDSTTLYALALSQKMEVYPFFFLYPSKHNAMERVAAQNVAAYYQSFGGHPLNLVELGQPFDMVKSHLLVGGGDIPSAPYSEASLAQTLVPGRNLIFASLLAAYAESLAAAGEAAFVALGVHGGDHALYPDCRPEFIGALEKTISLSSDGKVAVYTPFIQKTKAELVALGLALDVPYALTRSCYNGGDAPCRECGTCREREEAFAHNGVTDPVLGNAAFDGLS